VGPEEITTKIEISSEPESKLIYVDFKKNISSSRVNTSYKKNSWFKKMITNIDIRAPWVIRLVVILFILILLMSFL